MHYLFYGTKYIHVILTFASHLRDKHGNWGQSGVNVSKPAGYAVCDGNMSSSFFSPLADQYLKADNLKADSNQGEEVDNGDSDDSLDDIEDFDDLCICRTNCDNDDSMVKCGD